MVTAAVSTTSSTTVSAFATSMAVRRGLAARVAVICRPLPASVLFAAYSLLITTTPSTTAPTVPSGAAAYAVSNAEKNSLDSDTPESRALRAPTALSTVIPADPNRVTATATQLAGSVPALRSSAANVFQKVIGLPLLATGLMTGLMTGRTTRRTTGEREEGVLQARVPGGHLVQRPGGGDPATGDDDEVVGDARPPRS